MHTTALTRAWLQTRSTKEGLSLENPAHICVCMEVSVGLRDSLERDKYTDAYLYFLTALSASSVTAIRIISRPALAN